MCRKQNNCPGCFVKRQANWVIFADILVARFATEKIQPLVSEMDQNSEMDESIIKGMFDQGVSLIIESCYLLAK